MIEAAFIGAVIAAAIWIVVAAISNSMHHNWGHHDFGDMYDQGPLYKEDDDEVQ
jgi:hypothetical protein